MECLSDLKIQKYIDNSISKVEKSMFRDHLIICEKCRKKREFYAGLENSLKEPVMLQPPDSIIKNVMKKLYPILPSYSSIAALIASGITFLFTWIYIYFDFAHNSIIQTFKMASNETASWIGSVVKIISTIYTGTYAVFKWASAFIELVLKIHIGVEIIGLSVLVFSSGLFFFLYKFVSKKVKR